MELDELEAYTLKFLETPLNALHPVAVHNFGQVTGIVLLREPPMQVEMFLVKPEGSFPYEHAHPNVDSCEVAFCSVVPLTVDGEFPKWKKHFLGDQRLVRTTRVQAGQLHGAEFVPNGAAFISVQKWLDGVPPTSVALNWSGPPLGPEHAEQLKIYNIVR